MRRGDWPRRPTNSPPAPSPARSITSASRRAARPADSDHRGTAEKALDHIEHHDRLQAMQALKPREREALYRKGLGYSYTEIMQLTGASYTAVNRRLSE